MSSMIPAPIRDIVNGFSNIESIKSSANACRNQNSDPSTSIFNGLIGLAEQNGTNKVKDNMFKASLRIMIAAVGAAVLVKMGASLATGAVLGAFVSIPAVVIAGGSWMLYHGGSLALASLATGSFAQLGAGAAFVLGGYASLEGYRIMPFGVAEALL